MRLSLILILLSIGVHAQTLTLSDRASIHVVTCGPGQEELYSAFGHSAFRVTDPGNNLDLIYNYGVFDFNQPNFYLNFARGYLNYRLLRQDYRTFRDAYIYFDRSFTEQKLALNREQTQKLFEYLEWNNLPENRYYFYDYFYNNCATKITDAVEAALGGAVEFDGSHITDSKTIRQLTDDYLEYQPWGDLGIDICLGMPMDKIASPEIHRFLPDYVKLAFDNAYLLTDSARIPLVETTIPVYVSRSTGVPVTPFTPTRLFWGSFILMLVITSVGYLRGRYLKWVDVIWFSLLALLGIFLLLLWLATDHRAAAYNLNLLWALPLHVYTVYLLAKGKSLKPYFRFLAIWHIILILDWSFLPQQMHPAFLAFASISLLRSIRIWIMTKNGS